MHGADTDAIAGSEQRALPFVLMRGGTSKALFVWGEDLPADADARRRWILALYGSPDPRQIDGMGGADLLTSKLALIDPPSRSDADLDYTFAQVSITEPVVDYDINCGNISAAVGSYAVDQGLVEVTEPDTNVRIHNTNTGKILIARVPIVTGRAAIEGDVAVGGVPGTGAPIALDFAATVGGATGALLPTGNPADVLDTAIGLVEVSIVDLAYLCVYIPAEAVGMTGTEGPDEITDAHLEAVEAVRFAAAVTAGVATDRLVPVPVVVAPPASYVSFADGEKVSGDDIDLCGRVIAGRPPVLHKAFPGGGGACTGVAAVMEGTVAHRVYRERTPGRVEIGHPTGTMPVAARVEKTADGWGVHEAAYLRTARRLAEGTAYVRRRLVDGE